MVSSLCLFTVPDSAGSLKEQEAWLEEGTLQVGDRAIYSHLATRRCCGSDGGVVGPSQGLPWVGTHSACGYSKTGTGISRGSRQIPIME